MLIEFLWHWGSLGVGSILWFGFEALTKSAVSRWEWQTCELDVQGCMPCIQLLDMFVGPNVSTVVLLQSVEGLLLIVNSWFEVKVWWYGKRSSRDIYFERTRALNIYETPRNQEYGFLLKSNQRKKGPKKNEKNRIVQNGFSSGKWWHSVVNSLVIIYIFMSILFILISSTHPYFPTICGSIKRQLHNQTSKYLSILVPANKNWNHTPSHYPNLRTVEIAEN